MRSHCVVLPHSAKTTAKTTASSLPTRVPCFGIDMRLRNRRTTRTLRLNTTR